MILETICVGALEVNCYILASGKNSSAIVIDPGDDCHKIKKALDKYSLTPSFIINTHGHYDHIGCDDEFGVPIYIHQDDLTFAFPYNLKSEIKVLRDNQIISLDDIQLKVLHIPGHTPGGIALLMLKPNNKIVFTGDSLFCQGIGRTDFPYGNEGLLIKSIKEKLFTLSDDTVIYPGHGPSSTIGEEKSWL